MQRPVGWDRRGCRQEAPANERSNHLPSGLQYDEIEMERPTERRSKKLSRLSVARQFKEGSKTAEEDDESKETRTCELHRFGCGAPCTSTPIARICFNMPTLVLKAAIGDFAISNDQHPSSREQRQHCIMSSSRRQPQKNQDGR